MDDFTPFEFLSLPPGAQWNTMLQLDLESIMNLCSASKQVRELCNSEYFWKLKTLQDFPDADEEKDTTFTWKELYETYTIDPPGERSLWHQSDSFGWGTRIGLGMERDASMAHGAAFFAQGRSERNAPPPWDSEEEELLE